MADAAQDVEEPKGEERKRVQRRCQYLLLQWSIQILCALFCFLFVLWSAVQIMRIWDVLGVGAVPPGLEYAPADA